MYYVIDEGKFYYSSGSAYVFIDLTGPAGNDGADGQDGISITWLGAFSAHPENPQLNWAYYNSSDGTAYLWDGNAWEILATDGENGVSLNEQGVIEPGAYLALVHNLGRDDLTFEAQFVKNGYIYDYTEYRELFADEGELLVPPVMFEPAQSGFVVATTLENGDFAVAYQDGDNGNRGTFVIYDPEGNAVKAPEVFNDNETGGISATILQNGNFVIAYSDYGETENGSFAIYGKPGLALEKISSNEVRLWNRTSESLELMLSVNQ